MPWPSRSQVVRRAAVLLLVPVLLVTAANLVVLGLAHGRSSDDVADLPRAQTAIVPGALVMADGELSAVLRARIEGAVALYHSGVVRRILVSGDHGRPGYDETDSMRDAVLADGIPPAAVFTDYAGFDTWSTMRRARMVFGVTSAIVVTQGTFEARSVDLGEAAGLEIHALVVGGLAGDKARRSTVREVLARVKGLGEAATRPAVLLGPELPITGDGRMSWGPPDPLAPTLS